MMDKQICLNEWKREKILVGKQLYEAHKEMYDEWTMNFIKNKISSLVPSDSDLYSERFGNLTQEELFWLSIYDWWAFGCRSDEFIYYNFWNKTATEKDEYIIYRDRMKIVGKLNNKNDAHLLNNKYDTYTKLKSFYKRDLIKIQNEDDFSSFIDFIKKHEEFVAKPLGGGGSVGVHMTYVNEWDDEKKLFDNLLAEGRECDVQQRLLGNSTSAMVLEEVIVQDDSMAAFHPASVNNLRITSVRDGNDVRLFAPFFRCGAGGAFIASVSTGGINVAVDPETGEFISDGYTSKLDIYKEHPDSGIHFKGFLLPQYEEAKLMVIDMAKCFDTLGYIGWDLAYSKKGWDIIEANYAANPVGCQICLQRGLKKDFNKIVKGIL